MNESEFEAELRQIEPARPSPRLAERVAAELAAELHLASSNAVSLAPERQVQSFTPASGLLDLHQGSSARPRRWNLWLGLGWAVGGAAAAIAILLARGNFGEHHSSLNQLASQPPATAPSIGIDEEPDQSVAELISTEDEGVVYDSDDSQPQRQLRLTYLERHTWTNSQTGAVIEFEVPREDIVWMPVAMQ